MDFANGEQIMFYVGGNNHVSRTGTVIKVNRKTIKIEENPRSYSPGQVWICSKERLMSFDGYAGAMVNRGMCIKGFNERFYA